MWDIKWEKTFLFTINVLNKAECLVCNQVLKRPVESSLKRHYNACHSDLHSVVGIHRNELISNLKKKFKVTNAPILNVLPSDIDNSITCSQMKATYAITLALAKKGRPFEDGEFFKDICQSVMHLFGEPGQQILNIIKEIPLSSRTITRRTENIGLFIQSETNARIQNARYVSVCFDESNDICDTSQMIICIKTVDNYFNSFEEIFKLESFYGHVTGQTIYNAFERNVLSVIGREKLSAICTDGAPAMIGRKIGFVGNLIKAGIQVPTFHCIIHQQALFSKTLGFKEAMKTAVKIINRLRGGHNALTHRKLVAFLAEISADYGDVIMFTEVRWLSRGKCLERLFNLRNEITTFLQSLAGPDDAELLNSIKSPDFLYDLAFLTDVTRHINNLNLVLQGKNKNFCDNLYAVQQFSRKILILRDQMADQNLSNFPKVQEIFIQFPNVNKLLVFSEAFNTLLDNFQCRFKDFYNMQWILEIYRNPLTCTVENLPINIQTELKLMREDLFIPIETDILFWKNICTKKYAVCRDLILNAYSMFSTTYICEATFSAMSQIKNKYRNKLSDSHLETLLKIKCYENEIDIDKLIDFHNSIK